MVLYKNYQITVRRKRHCAMPGWTKLCSHNIWSIWKVQLIWCHQLNHRTGTTQIILQHIRNLQTCITGGGATSGGVERGRSVVILGFVDCQFFVAFSCDLCWWLVTLGGVLWWELEWGLARSRSVYVLLLWAVLMDLDWKRRHVGILTSRVLFWLDGWYCLLVGFCVGL